MQGRFVLFLCAGLIAGLVPAEGIAADAATEQARRHYLRGNQLFDVGHWDEAADEYERAYAIRSDPSLLYNMAQAYRRKGDAKRALDLYKNYLMKAPKTPQRAEVEERIRVLQKQVEDAEAASKGPGTAAAPAPASPAFTQQAGPAAPLAPAPPATLPGPAAPAPQGYQPAPPAPTYSSDGAPGASSWPGYPATVAPSPSPAGPYPSSPAWAPSPAPAYLQAPAAPADGSRPGRGLRIGGIVCGSVGVAMVGAGVVFSVLTKSYSDSVQTGDVFNPNFDERGKLYESLQWVGYGAGAGLVVTGAVLYTIGATRGAKANVALVPTFLPGGAGLSAGGAF